MSVRDDSATLLKFLAEVRVKEDDPAQGHHALAGKVIEEWTKLPPARLNDAVDYLEHRGLVKLLRALGTAPYMFYEVAATAEGRGANEERNQALEEAVAREVDANSWESYPEPDAADLVALLRRAAFDRDVRRACEESSERRPVGLLMVDIDHFKKVNDTCGHPGGDKVLVGVAELLRITVGRKGRAYRYGGEELSAILPDFSTEEAAVTAERFRLAVEARRWESEALPELRVTVSIGASSVAGGSAEAADDLVAAADKALYRAKGGGRNRVCIPTPP